MQSSSIMRWLVGPRVSRLTGPINLVLVLLLTYFLAQVTWFLLPLSEPSTKAIALPWSAPESLLGEDGDVTADGDRIATWHLLGEAVQEAEKPLQEIPREAPETKLRLTLRGVFTAQSNNEALAIVADDGGDEMPYRIGDDLPGGAQIKEIYADRIILVRSGRYETLRLPKEDMSDSAGWERPVYDQPVDDHGDGSEEEGADGAQDAGQVLQQYRQSLRDNPQSLMALVRPLPVLENGQFVGFRLLPGKDRSFLGKLGLQPGDVVVGVNGVELDSAANGMQALQVLQKDSNVNLEILRGGAPMSLSFEIPQ